MPFKLKENSSTQNGGRSLRSWIASSFQGTSKLREEDKQRKEWLKRNGKVLLCQRLAAFLGVRETFPLFSEQELKVATDNFNSTHIFWNVFGAIYYKGILPNGRVVYIKRYTRLVNIERMINEIVILSQLNHKNVEKLIGCCLETEYPLLVCEFFSKQTLSQLLYDAEDGSSIPWLTRLDIAVKIAGALVYLHSHQKQSLYHHSFPSIPIVHAALTPSCIFIDDKNHSIQLSNFYFATMIKDEDELQDKVFGVLEYMDPEFFETSKLTPKSDVFGFGVLLVEMLAGKKVFKITENDGKYLTKIVLEATKTDHLIEIVDRRIRSEAKVEHFLNVGEIVCNCLKDKGKERPTMREVTIKLRQLRMNLVST